MNDKQNNLFISLVVALSILSNVSPVLAEEIQQRPRVVVNIVVDQLRSDYLESFMPLCEQKGLMELLQGGRVYVDGFSPSLRADCATAISNIITGTVPAHHGVIAKDWFDRRTLQQVNCVVDNKCKGQNTYVGCSPRKLLVSTLGDEMKIGTSGQSLVYSIAPNSDAAVLAGGHAADGAFWIDTENAVWASSDYYHQEIPAWVQQANASITSSLREKWQPADVRAGVYDYFMGTSVHKAFSHSFKGLEACKEMKSSAVVNDRVTEVALACIEQTAVGVDDYPDLISVCYYAGPYGKENISDCITEIQDAYVRIDRGVSEILSSLKRKVGLEHAVVVLSSTGVNGVGIEADLEKYRVPTGIFDVKRASALLNMFLSATYGQGQYVQGHRGTQIYLNQELIQDKDKPFSELLERSAHFLSQLEGVGKVYTSRNLYNGVYNPLYASVRNAYYLGRSGDIYIEINPGWRYRDTEKDESHHMRSDAVAFPIIFYGLNIKPEKKTLPVSVTTIAPTLSKVMRIRAPNAARERSLF